MIDEDAAEIVRLIFYKYVFEGFGAQRLCKYLAEMNIYKDNGGNFPNTTINRIIKNELYAGVIHNGAAKSEVIPELQIIDRDTYERAQIIMEGRSQHHSDIPLNLKGGALLVGRVYCGHCGNRLTLTSSGRKTMHKDGSVTREMRPRYACHFKPRHPGECDGQSAYGVKKLDGIVDQVVRDQLQRIKTNPNTSLIYEQHQRMIDLAKVRLKMAKTQLAEKRREISDLQAETIRVIRGESNLSKDLLSTLLEKAGEEEKTLSTAVEEAQQSLNEIIQDDANRETMEFDRLLSWADIYDSCSFETKKMFLAQFIKAVRVFRDYNIEIEFNVSFDEFKNLKAGGEEIA